MMLDTQVIEEVRSLGVARLPRVLEGLDLASARGAFDQAYRDAGKGSVEPGTRVTLSGESLLGYPPLASLYGNRRVMDIVAAALSDPAPWLWMIRANRYAPPHAGIAPHSDGFAGELAPPFSRLAVAVFLDDIDAQSGALTFVPGSHRCHFEDATSQCTPMQTDIESASYTPVGLSAGDALLRVPETWHAVHPIHRLRRYFGGSFTTRGEVSPGMRARQGQTLASRRHVAPDSIPLEVRRFWVWED